MIHIHRSMKQLSDRDCAYNHAGTVETQENVASGDSYVGANRGGMVRGTEGGSIQHPSLREDEVRKAGSCEGP